MAGKIYREKQIAKKMLNYLNDFIDGSIKADQLLIYYYELEDEVREEFPEYEDDETPNIIKHVLNKLYQLHDSEVRYIYDTKSPQIIESIKLSITDLKNFINN